MGRVLALVTTFVLLCSPLSASAQDPRAALERASRALGAGTLRTLQYSANGVSFAVGQSVVPGSALAAVQHPVLHADDQLRDRLAPRGAGALAGRDAAAWRGRSRGRRGAADRGGERGPGVERGRASPSRRRRWPWWSASSSSGPRPTG